MELNSGLFERSSRDVGFIGSDGPGPAWAQSPGLGWASAGLGLSDLKPGPELRLGLGSGLIGLEPGLQI